MKCVSGFVARYGVRLACGVAALALAGPALAQDGAADAAAGEAASEGFYHDIIVTARKRAESLMDVPVAVSALGAQDINRYAANDLQKIGQMVPQVIIAKTGGGGAGASFAIRGIGSSSLDAGIEQTVSVNLDGIQVSRGRLATQGFFDIEQVEVLKGPQALFFGKNSPGGVISLRSAGATKTWQGYARAGYEFKADERFIEGAVSGPISETLGVRLAMRGQKMDGYMKNVAGPFTIPDDPDYTRPGAGDDRSPATEEVLARLTLEWTPTDRFNATAKVFVSDYKDNGETAGVETICDTTNNTLMLGAGEFVADPYGDCKLNGRRSSTALPKERAAQYTGARDGRPYTRYKSVLSSLTMNYELPTVTFTSVTGYWRYANKGFDNFDYTAAGAVWGRNDDTSQAFSQEIRAASDLDGPFNFVVGGYYEKMRRSTVGHGQIFALGLDPTTGLYNNWALRSRNRGTTWSFFGQAIIDITDNVELAGGARWTWEEKFARVGHSYMHDLLEQIGGFLPEGQYVNGHYRDDNWSPEVTLSWHPSDRSTLYVAYKTGYKSGGFSNPSSLASDATANDLRFGAETAKGGELGAKGSFLNGALSLNAAVYRYKFEDLQLTSFNAANATFSIRNAASARTTGAELEASYAVNEALSLRGAVGYNRAKYLNFAGAPCYSGQVNPDGSPCVTQDLTGTALPRAPKWNMNGGFTFDTPLTDVLALGFSADVNYTSGYWMQENQNPGSWQKGFARLNASVRLHEVEDAWELAVIGRNLTNKYYGVASFDKTLGTPDNIGIAIGRPREVLLQATYRFR